MLRFGCKRSPRLREKDFVGLGLPPWERNPGVSGLVRPEKVSCSARVQEEGREALTGGAQLPATEKGRRARAVGPGERVGRVREGVGAGPRQAVGRQAETERG